MTRKTRVLAGGIVRPDTKLRVDHTATADETVAVVSRPFDAVRVVTVGATFIEVENVTPRIALVAIVAGPSERMANAHRFGLLELVAGALGADITITGDKK